MEYLLGFGWVWNIFLGNSFIENNIPMSNCKTKRNVSSNCNSNSWIRFDFKSGRNEMSFYQ